MDVSIIAACLSAFKPLAANFFGVVSGLTSGEQYGSRYGSRNATNARSQPYVYNGYLKQSERRETQSYAMGKMVSDDAKVASSFEQRGFADGTASYGPGKRRGSSAAESDENVLLSHKGVMRITDAWIF